MVVIHRLISYPGGPTKHYGDQTRMSVHVRIYRSTGHPMNKKYPKFAAPIGIPLFGPINQPVWISQAHKWHVPSAHEILYKTRVRNHLRALGKVPGPGDK